jgi:hypothetical protein
MTTLRRIQIVAGIVFSFGIALLLARYGVAPKAALDARLAGEAMWWGALAVLLLHAVFVERRPLSSIGFRKPGWQDAAIASGAALLIVVGTVFVYMVLFPVLLLSISMSHIPNTILMPYWYRLVMVLRIAVAGEILFRAYAIERGEELFPGIGKWLAAALSLAVYVAADWSSWSPVESIASAFGGLVLTALYLWRRSIWANVVASGVAGAAGWLMQ